MEDESDATAEAALAQGDAIFVPPHWPTETLNALRSAERSGRLAPDVTFVHMRRLGGLQIEVDDAPWVGRLARSLHLSRRYALTVYDAAYLELAERRDIPLATLDGELLAVLARPEFAHLRFDPPPTDPEP